MKNKILYLPLLLLALLAGVLTLGLPTSHMQDSTSSPLVGQKLAAIDVPMLGAGGHFSNVLWKGNIALVSVFASWCVPCALEHPVLMRLAKDDKIPMYGLVWKDKPAKAQQWLHDHGNPFRATGIDTEGQTTVALALSGVPETFIVDGSGTIVFHNKSPITDDMVNMVILPLIEKLRHAQ